MRECTLCENFVFSLIIAFSAQKIRCMENFVSCSLSFILRSTYNVTYLDTISVLFTFICFIVGGNRRLQLASMGVYEGLTQIKPGMHWVSVTFI